ncbi:S-adenosyl-L-methionine-dependent methyltransferase [Xylariaceae sp. FL0662B]|nr:S-adenosyl-L-methionine-dependent methyltransferase [Xylariaceae sp. FL0662B]
MSGGTPPKEKIRLQGVEQTLLPMVMFKIRDAESPHPILGDPYAKQLLDRCDVDLEASHFSATMDPRYVTWIANRAKRFDDWCQEFLDAHQEPVTVLHLGCGLDCRYFRVKRRPGAEVWWIDLDQPMVVDLRRRLIPGPVEGDYALRTLDVTREGWYRDVPSDRPTMIIAEGVMPYLEPEEGQKLIKDLVEYFGGSEQGGGCRCQLVFDTLGSLSVRLTKHIKALRSSRAMFKWGVDEPEQLLGIHPRLQLKDRILWREYMDGHPPFFGKYGTALAAVMPSFNKNIQFWRFDF